MKNLLLILCTFILFSCTSVIEHNGKEELYKIKHQLYYNMGYHVGLISITLYLEETNQLILNNPPTEFNFNRINQISDSIIRTKAINSPLLTKDLDL